MTQVYSGSLRYEFRDPFVTVIGLDEDKVKDLLGGYEFSSLCDSVSEDERVDDIITLGVFPSTLEEHDLDESQIHDLEVNGYIIIWRRA